MISKRLASPAIAVVALAALSAVASAATVTQTSTVTLNAAYDGVVALPDTNSQFSETIKVNDGTAFWGPAADSITYKDGVYVAGNPQASGLWGNGDDPTVPGHGPILLEGVQVGAVIYRLDGVGEWQAVKADTKVSGNHTVQVAINDRPGSYDDNSGSLTITVVRSK